MRPSGSSLRSGVGYESTDPAGHIGALFACTVVDPRFGHQLRVDAIHQEGAIAVMNHPEYDAGYSADLLLAIDGYRLIEISNHLHTVLPAQLEANLEKWRQVVNERGPSDPV